MLQNCFKVYLGDCMINRLLNVSSLGHLFFFIMNGAGGKISGLFLYINRPTFHTCIWIFWIPFR